MTPLCRHTRLYRVHNNPLMPELNIIIVSFTFLIITLQPKVLKSQSWHQTLHHKELFPSM